MKGILFYHSNSGNTQLVCNTLQHQLQAVKLTLHDVADKPLPDMNQFDIVGFATWTYFLGLPPFFQTFLDDLPQQTGKPAFAMNTFGMMSGQAIKRLTDQLNAKGFVVIAAHSLHTPESYPPYIIKGWDNIDAPDTKLLKAFHNFIGELDKKLTQLIQDTPVTKTNVKIGLFNHLIRPYSLTKARKQMGTLFVDTNLCTECGLCAEKCLYNAITMNPNPMFDAEKCHVCWACFNHCPEKAIFTEKIKSVGHYSEPNPHFTEKMSVEKVY
ncbi:MAG: hypothetical protein DWQ04_22150 [Chloroflexi bacterium]|nr:MAG: hypothetical protein DWQ04_22150 [Chloroflexota bacterium]